MEFWDDEPDNRADIIDRFIIAIPGTVSSVNEFEPMIIEGVNGIGNLRIAYYNFTTDDQLHVVPSCSSSAISTTANTSSTSKNNIQYIICDCYTLVYKTYMCMYHVLYVICIYYNTHTIGINTVWETKYRLFDIN